MKNIYSVLVGNVGNVLSCTNFREALKSFTQWKAHSKAGYGRASLEGVALMNETSGEILREYFSPCQEMRSDLENGECATLNSDGEIFLCGKLICTVGNDISEKQGLRMLREAMKAQGFFPNLYRITDHGNVSLISARTGKAYKGKEWV